MKKLLIVGAGGWGRVVRQWALDIQLHAERWESIKFLDDNPKVLEGLGLCHELAGSIRDYQPSDDEEVICGIGDPEIKLEFVSNYERKAQFSPISFIPMLWLRAMEKSEWESL